MSRILIFLFSSTTESYGQDADLHISKNKNRYSLLIEIYHQDTTERYSVNCFAEPVTHLPDPVKMHLIKKLLCFEKDTSLCVWPVRKLHPLSTQLHIPFSNDYRLQVEALLLINLLAFGSDVFVFSPFPVLQNINTGEEIGIDQMTISKVYSVYRDWFRRISLFSEEGFTFPDLSKIGIKWFGMDSTPINFETMGKWSTYFDCIEIE